MKKCFLCEASKKKLKSCSVPLVSFLYLCDIHKEQLKKAYRLKENKDIRAIKLPFIFYEEESKISKK